MVTFFHKILIPQRPDYLVARPRLTALLQAIESQRLVVLAAPAGYGKTSLLIDFAHSALPHPVCWYTIDAADQEPWTFLAYLAAAIGQQFPGLLPQTAHMTDGQSQMPLSAVVAVFTREVYAIPSSFILILDDWQLVDSVPEIRSTVDQLLRSCPNCRIVLSSREYPSLSDIMLLAARRQMTGVGSHLLRFTPPEVAAILGGDSAPGVQAQAAALVEQSDGWITGILLSLQTSSGLFGAAGGSQSVINRQVYQFLTEQVFLQQTPAIQSFLLESALLEEMTAEQCNTLLGRSDAGLQLEVLLHRQLFISEVTPGVLRYHPLFREFLLDRYRKLDLPGFQATAVRVAAGYTAQGQWLRAFEYCVQAGDTPAAQRILTAGGEQLYTSGRIETLERFFALLPQESLGTALLCLKAQVAIDRGRVSEAQTLVDTATVALQPAELPMVLVVRALIARVSGRYEQAVTIAQQLLELPAEPGQHAVALRTIGICKHRFGQTQEAIESLQAAIRLETQRGNLAAVAKLNIDLGICHQDIGQLQSAETYYNHADAYWATVGNLGLRAVSLNGKGGVQHLRGAFEAALDTLREALQYAKDTALQFYVATIQSSLGDLYCDLQMWEQAREAYSQGRQVGGSAHMNCYLELCEVRLLLRQGQYEAAARGLRQLGEVTRQSQALKIQLFQLHIACGLRGHAEAERILVQVWPQVEALGPSPDSAYAHLLKAWALSGQVPLDGTALCAALDRVEALARHLGHDVFLIAELTSMGGLLRHAGEAGWQHAAAWAQRQQDIALVGRRLSNVDERPVLQVRTLGGESLRLNGAPVEIGWVKAREILYYLLAHPEGATSDVLSEAIWPDSAKRSRTNLWSAIHQLRSAIHAEIITRKQQSYQIDRSQVWVDYDVDQFLEIVDTRADDQEALFSAFALVRGPYLPASDAQWTQPLRMHIEQRYLRALRLAAERAERGGQYGDALSLYTRILTTDELDEAAHEAIMRCYIALGNRAAAIAQYQRVRQLIDDELGLELGSSSGIEQLYRQLLDDA